MRSADSRKQRLIARYAWISRHALTSRSPCWRAFLPTLTGPPDYAWQAIIEAHGALTGDEKTCVTPGNGFRDMRSSSVHSGQGFEACIAYRDFKVPERNPYRGPDASAMPRSFVPVGAAQQPPSELDPVIDDHRRIAQAKTIVRLQPRFQSLLPWRTFATTIMNVVQRLRQTAIDRVSLPTLAAFVPLLEEKKAEINKIERNEFKYGETSRHYLDVYYPPSASALSTSNGKLPVLFFIYGGGYNTGSRILPAPYDMGYRALGSFFAARGFLTVIPDYRLVSEAQFPGASEDLRDALLWVAGHAAEVTGGATDPESARTELDLGYVFILGHSAGASHSLVLHLYPPLRTGFAEKAAEMGLRVRGLVLNGCQWSPSMIAAKFGIPPPVAQYYGDEAQLKEREPRGLWLTLTEDDVRAFPETLLIQAEREPDTLKATKDVMENEMRERLKSVGRELQETYTSAKHNHMSANWVLSTGDKEGEKWGYDVVEWIQARLA